MVRPSRCRALVCLLLGAALLGGCAAEDPAELEEQARVEEWTAIQQQKEQLDAKRSTYQQSRQQGESAGAAANGAPGGEAPAGQAEQLGKEIEEEAGAFYNRLVEFINSDPPVQGEPLSDRQLAAVRMKGEEDILLAQEYIDQGGDYARAIQIYQDALLVDPENERLQEKLVEAKERRYMTQERFSRIKKGMTEQEVVDAVGRPYYRNVRDFEDRGVRAWFYPKDETRAAAAVWFQKQKGAFKVYKLDFNAAQGQGQEG